MLRESVYLGFMILPQDTPEILTLIQDSNRQLIRRLKHLPAKFVLSSLFHHTKATTPNALARDVVEKFVSTSRHTAFGTILDYIITEAAKTRADWNVSRPDKTPDLKKRYKGIDVIIKQGALWYILSCKLGLKTQNGSHAADHFKEMMQACLNAREDGASKAIPIFAYIGQDPQNNVWFVTKTKKGLDHEPGMEYHHVYGRALFEFITGNPHFWQQVHEIMRNQDTKSGLLEAMELKIGYFCQRLLRWGFTDESGLLLWDRLFELPCSRSHLDLQLQEMGRILEAPPSFFNEKPEPTPDITALMMELGDDLHAQ